MQETSAIGGKSELPSGDLQLKISTQMTIWSVSDKITHSGHNLTIKYQKQASGEFSRI